MYYTKDDNNSSKEGYINLGWSSFTGASGFLTTVRSAFTSVNMPLWYAVAQLTIFHIQAGEPSVLLYHSEGYPASDEVIILPQSFGFENKHPSE